jgi:hypothetical protein
MTFVQLISIPETRYIGLPVAATILTGILTAISRPYGHKWFIRADFKVGLGWSMTAILLWSFEAATAESTHAGTKWPWWTPVVLVGLLAVSTYVVLEYGWEREDRKPKDPLIVSKTGTALSLLTGALSLIVLYIEMRGST